MNKISVIVPNHLNKNLDKLVDEIIKFKPLEIIIINNKSEVDNSKNKNDTIKHYNISEKKKTLRQIEIMALQKLKVIFYFS